MKEKRTKEQKRVKKLCKQFHQEGIKILAEKKEELKTISLQNLLAINEAMHYFKKEHSEVLKLGLMEQSNSFIRGYFDQHSMVDYLRIMFAEWKEEDSIEWLPEEQQTILKKRIKRIIFVAQSDDFFKYRNILSIMEDEYIDVEGDNRKEFNQLREEIKQIIFSAQQSQIEKYLGYLNFMEGYSKDILDFCFSPFKVKNGYQLEGEMLGECLKEIVQYNRIANQLCYVERIPLKALETIIHIDKELKDCLSELLDIIPTISEEKILNTSILDFIL